MCMLVAEVWKGNHIVKLMNGFTAPSWQQSIDRMAIGQNRLSPTPYKQTPLQTHHSRCFHSYRLNLLCRYSSWFIVQHNISTK